MPDDQDYLDLETSLELARDFAIQVSRQAPALVAQARQADGREVRGNITERLSVVVKIVGVANEDEALEEIWVGFDMPPFAGSCALPPHPEWIQVVLAAMVPVEITIADLEFGGRFPRESGSGPNEIVVCWRSF